MKKRLLSVLLTLLMVFTMIPFFGINVSSAENERPPVLTNPAISPVWQKGNDYKGELSSEVSNSSKLRIKWEDVSAPSYKVAVKALDGEPALGENEPGESLYPYTEGYKKTYIDLTAAQIKESAGKWIKVYIQPCYSTGGYYNCHYYFKIKPLDTLTKPDITVIAVNSSSIEISWDKVSGATMYDIYRSTKTTASSFKLVKSTSATSWTDTGLAASTRYYYKVKARNSSTESGFSNRDYDTTDAASEGRFDSAPTLSLGAYGNELGTDYYGPYIAGDTVYFYFTADNSDHVFVQTSSTDLKFDDADGNPTYAGTFVEKTSPSESDAKERYTNGTRYQIDVKVPRGIESGDYTITVTATDGVYDPELEGSIAGTAQYPSVKKSVKIKVIENSSGETGDRPTTLAEAKNMVDLSTNKNPASVVRGRIRRVSQVTGDPYYCSEHWNYPGLQAAKMCTRCAYSEALSYLGIDCTPAKMSELYGSAGLYEPSSTDVYNKITEKLNNANGYNIKSDYGTISKLDEMYSNYATDYNYSPVYLYFSYTKSSGSSSGHAILLIGRSDVDKNTYYAVDSNCASTKNVFEIVLSGSEIVSTDYSSNYTAYYYKGGTVKYIYQWSLDDSSPAKTATITYNANGGSNAPASTSGKVGETVKLSTSVPTRTNYKFKGWSTSSGASTPEYASGASYKLTGNVTLYAVWEKIESSTHIRGDANGDGVKNISDFTYVLVHIVTNGVVNKVEESVDYNGDGAVTIADATYLLINIVTNGLVNGNLH